MLDRRGRSLTLRVRLLADPPLWCWEIRDIADERLVEGCWQAEWTAYESAEDALEAGRRRLAQLLVEPPPLARAS